MQNQQEILQGADSERVYSEKTLGIYDWFVLGLSNRFWWKCPTKKVLSFYNTHISANHLDIGVGTGYFLDKCTYPSAQPNIMLADLNTNCLEKASQRISRYNPRTTRIDILKPFKLFQPFDSIGINYLIHCLPGPMEKKAPLFNHLKEHLNPGGVVFGTTILNVGVPQNRLAKMFINTYNKKKIFGNLDDNRQDLEKMLSGNFEKYKVTTTGCVAFFWGKN